MKQFKSVFTLGGVRNVGFISQAKAIELHEPFEDSRSIAAKRYRIAQQNTKPEMVSAMVKRALNAGIMANYLLADAWFGTKAMIRLTQETALVPVLRMKKNNMKYRMYNPYLKDTETSVLGEPPPIINDFETPSWFI